MIGSGVDVKLPGMEFMELKAGSMTSSGSKPRLAPSIKSFGFKAAAGSWKLPKELTLPMSIERARGGSMSSCAKSGSATGSRGASIWTSWRLPIIGKLPKLVALMDLTIGR